MLISMSIDCAFVNFIIDATFFANMFFYDLVICIPSFNNTSIENMRLLRTNSLSQQPSVKY